MPRMHIVTVTPPPTHTLQPRAPQTITTTTSDRPYFPDPSSYVPPQKNDPPNTKDSLTKAVLEYTLLAVGVVIISCLIIHRLSRLKRTNQPFRNFFSWSSSSGTTITQQRRFPRTTGLPSLGSLPFYPSAAYDPQDRRTRGRDTDAHGRRLGTTGGEYDYDHDDKDLLPAYDTTGGPPKYIDVELDLLGRNRAGGGSPAGPGIGAGYGVRRPTGEPGRGSGGGASSPTSSQVSESSSIWSSLPFRSVARTTPKNNTEAGVSPTTPPGVPEGPSTTTTTIPPHPRADG